MDDFLSRVAERATGTASLIRPAHRSLFAGSRSLFAERLDDPLAPRPDAPPPLPFEEVPLLVPLPSGGDAAWGALLGNVLRAGALEAAGLPPSSQEPSFDAADSLEDPFLDPFTEASPPAPAATAPGLTATLPAQAHPPPPAAPTRSHEHPAPPPAAAPARATSAQQPSVASEQGE
ncbi:MAG: hypothetical protein ACXU88_07825, partial [Myxococcaceae bacterium]